LGTALANGNSSAASISIESLQQSFTNVLTSPIGATMETAQAIAAIKSNLASVSNALQSGNQYVAQLAYTDFQNSLDKYKALMENPSSSTALPSVPFKSQTTNPSSQLLLNLNLGVANSDNANANNLVNSTDIIYIYQSSGTVNTTPSPGTYLDHTA
jgi:hypothetical protein